MAIGTWSSCAEWGSMSWWDIDWKRFNEAQDCCDQQSSFMLLSELDKSMRLWGNCNIGTACTPCPAPDTGFEAERDSVGTCLALRRNGHTLQASCRPARESDLIHELSICV